MSSDALPWSVLAYIQLTEAATTSSSRIFVKILFQELSEILGLVKLNGRLQDPLMAPYYAGIFPAGVAKDMRFAINFFTSIGLGGLTDKLRAELKELPKLQAAQQQAALEAAQRAAAAASSSSSSSSSSSDSDSDSDSDSSSSSSSSSDSSSSSSSDSSSSSSSSSSSRRARERTRPPARERRALSGDAACGAQLVLGLGPEGEKVAQGLDACGRGGLVASAAAAFARRLGATRAADALLLRVSSSSVRFPE